LIDEPSAYLDVEQRVVAARVMKRFAEYFPPLGKIFFSTHTFKIDTQNKMDIGIGIKNDWIPKWLIFWGIRKWQQNFERPKCI